MPELRQAQPTDTGLMWGLMRPATEQACTTIVQCAPKNALVRMARLMQ
jgi:hypothetical protein